MFDAISDVHLPGRVIKILMFGRSSNENLSKIYRWKALVQVWFGEGIDRRTTLACSGVLGMRQFVQAMRTTLKYHMRYVKDDTIFLGEPVPE